MENIKVNITFAFATSVLAIANSKFLLLTSFLIFAAA